MARKNTLRKQEGEPQHDVGRSLQARPGRDHGEDQRLHRLRPEALRAGHRGLAGACRHAGGAGHPDGEGRPRHQARAWRRCKAEIESGKFKFSTKLEDIHFNVEARLTELIGPAGGRLHTARSRNDQVALDVRLWVRDTIDRLEAMLRDLQAALIDRAEEYAATIMPGFTHLQTAQPITFGHHLLAYVEMFGRDRSRLARLPRAA